MASIGKITIKIIFKNLALWILVFFLNNLVLSKFWQLLQLHNYFKTLNSFQGTMDSPYTDL